MIARRGTAHGSGLGRERWVVERGFAHLHNFRRLRIIRLAFNASSEVAEFMLDPWHERRA